MITFYCFGIVFLTMTCLSFRPIHIGYSKEYLSLMTTKQLKGIVAYAIIIHHLSQKMQVPGLLSIIGYIGFICVAVFFFISGYGLECALKNKENYLKHFFHDE